MSSLGGNANFDFSIGDSRCPSSSVGGGGGRGDGVLSSELGIAEISEFKTEYVLAEIPSVVESVDDGDNDNSYIQPLENIGGASESYMMTPQAELSSYLKNDLLLGADTDNTIEFGSVVTGTGFPPVPVPLKEEYNLVKVEEEEEASPQRFEKSLITLNDISNYRASGLDWIEGGASNWLSFDQGASLGVPDLSIDTNEPATPSLCTSSMYNFYDEEEDECQKEFEGMEVDGEDSKTFYTEAVHSATIQKHGHIIGIGTNSNVVEEEDDDDDDNDDEEDYSDLSDEENKHDVQIDTTSKMKPSARPRRSETCPLCNIEFPTPGLFEKHMKNEHEEAFPYPCPSCEKKFAKNHQLEAHARIHDPERYKGEPKWQCDHCEKKYHVRTTLYSHYRKAHPGKRPLKPHEKENKKRKISNHLQRQCPGASVKKTLNKAIKNQRKRSAAMTTQAINNNTQIDQTSASPEANPLSGQDDNSVAPSTNELAASAATEITTDSRPGHYHCTTCDKVFALPSLLREHVLLHTGEKPWLCPYCDETFRIKQTLTYHIQRHHSTKEDRRNILKLHKCRVCGQDDFYMFNKLHVHRTRQHRNVPYEKEKEKTFGCGACLKPYFSREDAIICALLAHDPTHLRKTMFKYKCPKCPEERLGYYKQTLLKKHLEEEHQEKHCLEDLIPLTWESLPSVRVNKVKAADIKENGLPIGITFECPLYFDLTEFGPSEREQHLVATLILKILSVSGVPDGPQTCTICGTEFSNKGNLKRHLSTNHISEEMLTREREEKELEGDEATEERLQLNGNGRKRPIFFANAATPSEKEVENIFEAVISQKKISKVLDSDDNEKNASDKEEEQPVISSFKCKFCDKSFPKKRALQFHEVRGHINPKKSKKEPTIQNTQSVKNTQPAKKAQSPKKKVQFAPSSSSSCSSVLSVYEDSSDDSLFEAVVMDQEKRNLSRTTVNINDTDAVNALLNYQSFQIILSRVEITPPSEKQKRPDNNITTAMQKEASKIVKPKELKKMNNELPPFEPVIIVREKKTDDYGMATAKFSQRRQKQQQLSSNNGNQSSNTLCGEEEDEKEDLVKNPSPPRIVTRRRSSLAIQKQQKYTHRRKNDNDLFVLEKMPKVVLRRVKLADQDDSEDEDKIT